MKRKIRAILTAFFLAGIMVMPVSAAEGASNAATEDGITVTITTDKEEYNAGEEIHYSIMVENNKKYWNLNPVSFSYSNSDGIIPVSEDSMPTELPEIASGEGYKRRIDW